jgi:ribosomal-protein-alanine N-acetyltransferase
MTDFPIIKTERLILQPICYKDASNLFKLLSQLEVCIYNNFTPLDDKQQAKNLIQQDLENSYNNMGIRFAIKSHEGKFLGSCGVHQYDSRLKVATIGYELEPLFWRQGLMQEALTALFRYLFSQKSNFPVKIVNAYVLTINTASLQLLAKLGFVNNNQIKTTNNVQCYDLSKLDWKNQQNNY